jgi:PhzF family phenazine biosynthesis protein
MTKTSVPFAFVDVFASTPLTGNPLALVMDADELELAQFQAIAREFNQSETTFLLRPGDPRATIRLRSFTPIGAEVFGAGHNALGAWLWLGASGRLDPDDGTTFTQQIGDDILPVEIARAEDGSIVVTMDQSAAEFGAVVDDPAELAMSLGLRTEDIAQDAPAQVVSTGATHLLVPLVDRDAVDRAIHDAPRLARVLADVGGEGCYLWTTDVPAGSDAVAYARFFNPTVGIVEDPATGTAAGPLAALLARLGRVHDAESIVIEQGSALGRRSLITVSVFGDRVRISGGGVVSAQGTLAL